MHLRSYQLKNFTWKETHCVIGSKMKGPMSGNALLMWHPVMPVFHLKRLVEVPAFENMLLDECQLWRVDSSCGNMIDKLGRIMLANDRLTD